MTSSTVFTACLYLKHLIVYFFKDASFLVEKWKIMKVLKLPYLRLFLPVFFNFTSVDYDLFVTGTQNWRDCGAPFQGYGAAKKWGSLRPPPLQHLVG